MKKCNFKRLSVLLIIFLLSLKVNGYAGVQKSVANSGKGRGRSLIISGFTDNSNIKDSVTFQVYQHYFKAAGLTNDNVFVSKVQQNNFQFKLNAITDPVYIKISFPKGNGGDNIFLAEPGDSIFMKVTGDSISFSGIGAERFSCQQKIFAKGDVKAKRIDDFYYFLQDIRKQMDSIYEPKFEFLKSYQAKISKSSYEILNADLTSKKYLKMMSDIRYYFEHRNKEDDKRNIIKFYDSYTRELAGFLNVDNGSYLTSRAYSDFLFEKERCKVLFSYWYKGRDEIFSNLYKSLKENYRGAIREKLIVTCFLELFQKSDNASLFLEDAVNQVHDKEYKSILQNMLATRAPGSMAYDFNLESASGEQVALKKFRGKTVIIDFWFNGCIGCINLNKVMKNVIDTFLYRDDVVFVSINVDKDKDRWKKGILAGIYTHKESLNLFTNGLGYDHPMIYHYGYKGFPQLLIIDKEGKVLSANPPLPFDKQSFDKLIQLINTYQGSYSKLTP